MRRSFMLLAAAIAVPAHASVAEDTADVPRLIAAYHQAVTTHDGARLAAMFVPQGSAWFSVLSDTGLARLRAAKPDMPRVKPGSVEQFVAMVSTSKANLDPEHEDLKITSDGAVATVTFRFRFLIDGHEGNRGIESWQLVHGDAGWRIASIVYSSTPPAAR